MITSVQRLLLAFIDDTATQSPTRESVDRRTRDKVVIMSVLREQLLLLIGGVTSSESGEFLVALFADRWHHNRSEGLAFILVQPGSQMRIELATP
ncbi:hypothetical protein TNCV_2053051 [Trichonephila clavipes]|nr:hypothetical protein TNCV_2053051 [Trichonephila clavipes]